MNLRGAQKMYMWRQSRIGEVLLRDFIWLEHMWLANFVPLDHGLYLVWQEQTLLSRSFIRGMAF